MKKLTSILAVAGMFLLLGSCSQSAQKNQDTNADSVAAHQMVKPLPAGIDTANITDATVAATFSSSDFDWAGGKLKFTVYAEDLYDAAQVSKLSVGDTLVYSGTPIVVEKIDRKDDMVSVNGDIDDGGALLQASKQGGTYRAMQLDDHSVYTRVGTATLPVSASVTIIDCRENPTDPSDTIKAEQKKFVQGLKESKKQFTCLDTQVQIEKGTIVGITRKWIP